METYYFHGLLCSYFGNMAHCLLSNSFLSGCSQRDKQDYQYLSRRILQKTDWRSHCCRWDNRLIMDTQLQSWSQPENSVHKIWWQEGCTVTLQDFCDLISIFNLYVAIFGGRCAAVWKLKKPLTAHNFQTKQKGYVHKHLVINWLLTFHAAGCSHRSLQISPA